MSHAHGLVSFTRIEGETLDRIVAARSPQCGAGLDDRQYRRWQQARMQTAWGRNHIRPVALAEGDHLRASAMQYHLVGVLDGRPIRVCGVGSVWSHGGAPGDAAACALVDQVLDRALADGAEMAVLFSPMNEDWCRRRRMWAITPPTLHLRIAPLRRPGTPMLPTRAGEDRDLAAIAALGHVRAAPFRFHLNRDVDFIQHAIVSRRLLAGLQPDGGQQVLFFVAEEGGVAAAYVVLTAESSEWTLHECGDRDPSGARVGAILQGLLARDPSAPAPVIRGSLPHGFVPPQATAVEVAGHAVIMAGPLGPEPAIHRLGPSDALYWLGDMC